MTVKQVITEGRFPVKVWTNEVEAASREQLVNISKMPFVFRHVAAMADCHWGNGTSVGTVIATHKALIPAAVGVDIGCGMSAQKLNITADQLPDSLGAVRSAIEAAVPHGRTDNGGDNDRGAWGTAPEQVLKVWGRFHDSDERFNQLLEKHPKLVGNFGKRGSRQLATLGTGNHFIELCTDTEGGVWIMLHSGSRGVGNTIGTYFIDAAKREMETWSIELPDPNLAYLPEASPLFADYWAALSWAQDYALANRALMMQHAVAAVEKSLGRDDLRTGIEAVNCHHNYAQLEHHFGKNVYVTRKGAVRARAGDLGIIPGSMGAKSFIVRGLGNEESFCSCSHGAGRKMSRGEAKKRFTVEDLKQQTAGVECRKDAEVIDEIPGAYKDIDTVMANQSDLVEIVATLKQLVTVKG